MQVSAHVDVSGFCTMPWNTAACVTAAPPRSPKPQSPPLDLRWGQVSEPKRALQHLTRCLRRRVTHLSRPDVPRGLIRSASARDRGRSRRRGEDLVPPPCRSTTTLHRHQVRGGPHDKGPLPGSLDGPGAHVCCLSSRAHPLIRDDLGADPPTPSGPQPEAPVDVRGLYLRRKVRAVCLVVHQIAERCKTPTPVTPISTRVQTTLSGSSGTRSLSVCRCPLIPKGAR